MALAAGGYIYFGTSLLPFNYPVRKAKIAALESEHEKLAAEVEKARKVVQAATQGGHKPHHLHMCAFRQFSIAKIDTS